MTTSPSRSSRHMSRRKVLDRVLYSSTQKPAARTRTAFGDAENLFVKSAFDNCYQKDRWVSRCQQVGDPAADAGSLTRNGR